MPEEKLDVGGHVRATGFIGNGSGLTDLDGSQITTGIIPPERIELDIPQSEDLSFGKKIVEFAGHPGANYARSFVAANGDVWVFWYGQIHTRRTVRCRRYRNGSWSEDMVAARGNSSIYIYDLLEDEDSDLWLFGQISTAGVNNAWCSRFDGSGWEREIQLTSGTASKGYQKPFTDPAGSIWFFWQDYSDPGRNIAMVPGAPRAP